jgi:hypothetical protein
MGREIFGNQLHALKERKVTSRFIITITKESLSYCKEVMRIGELRHMDGVKGNVAVSETEFMVAAVLQESQSLPQVIYGNAKGDIEQQQQHFFDVLWARPSQL